VSEVADFSSFSGRFSSGFSEAVAPRPAAGVAPATGALRSAVERAQAGDTAAFTEIVSWYQRRIVSTAWRILGDENEALDAAQDVFLRLHRYLRSFDPTQDFGAWLYRMVVNACHDARRRRPLHLSLEDDRARGTVADLRSGDDVEASAGALEDERVLAAALQTLSEKERAALVLRDLEGLSTQEVADALGSTPTTVRSQISIARGKLRAFRERASRPAVIAAAGVASAGGAGRGGTR
jgi:RNA polymerase sigma-70 factor (ECF subfamily)